MTMMTTGDFLVWNSFVLIVFRLVFALQISPNFVDSPFGWGCEGKILVLGKAAWVGLFGDGQDSEELQTGQQVEQHSLPNDLRTGTLTVVSFVLMIEYDLFG